MNRNIKTFSLVLFLTIMSTSLSGCALWDNIKGIFSSNTEEEVNIVEIQPEEKPKETEQEKEKPEEVVENAQKEELKEVADESVVFEPLSNEILDTLQKKRENGEEVSVEEKDEFLEYAAEVLYREMRKATDLSNPPKEVTQMFSLLKTFEDSYITPVVMLPKDSKIYEQASEHSRKLCLAVFTQKNNKPKEIIATAGNECHPAFITKESYIEKNNDGNRKVDVISISNAAEQFFAKEQKYPASVSSLVTNKYLTELPEDPVTGEPYVYETSADRSEYCVWTTLRYLQNQETMKTDGGNSDIAFEKGNYCNSVSVGDSTLISEETSFSLSEEETADLKKSFLQYATGVFADHIMKASSLDTIPKEIREMQLILQQLGEPKDSIETIYLSPKTEKEFIQAEASERKVCVAFPVDTGEAIMSGNACHLAK